MDRRLANFEGTDNQFNGGLRCASRILSVRSNEGCWDIRGMKEDKCIQSISENPKGRDLLEGLRVSVRIILKCILNRVGICWLDLFGFEQEGNAELLLTVRRNVGFPELKRISWRNVSFLIYLIYQAWSWLFTTILRNVGLNTYQSTRHNVA